MITEFEYDAYAAVARKDYQDRRRRQKAGIEKATSLGLYTGRRENIDLHEKIEMLLGEGKPYTMIMKLLGCSRGTIVKVSNKIKNNI